MMLWNFLVTRVLALCAAGFAIATTPASAWEAAHGDRDNSGFANVTTAPAGAGSVTVPGLGTFRPGAGPVIAPDGTIYLGTAEGRLIALQADGKPLWSRDITPGQAIVASPAIAADGSIYVIGVSIVRDNRVEPPKVVVTSTLHRFNSTGAWLAQIPFPDHGGIGPAAVAPPNIGRFGGIEAIIVPTLYANRLRGWPSVRLVAFDLNGKLLDDVVMRGFASDITGGPDLPGMNLELCCKFTPPKAGDLVEVPPMPGVGIGTGNGGLVMASDHSRDLIGYSFINGRFKEVLRLHQGEDFVMRSPPVFVSGNQVAIGLQETERPEFDGRLLLTNPNTSRTTRIDVPATHAAPTRLLDGSVVMVGTRDKVTVIKGSTVVATLSAPGRSLASAAASRNHFFVSVENSFVTYDAATLDEVSRVDWVGGGLHPPAIGPKGHVYAIASDILFVFPPPIKKPMTVVNQPQGGLPVATNPGSGTAPRQQSYEPPLTASGNRLFACEELDQDDCGKGDHKDISLAWCQKQGYQKVNGYDVDSRKVKAETLDGQFCTKSKCKVFEEIGCANN